jgi:hypothetical protein
MQAIFSKVLADLSAQISAISVISGEVLSFTIS